MNEQMTTALMPIKRNARAFVFMCCAVLIALVGSLPNNGSVLQRMVDDHHAHGATFAHMHVAEKLPLKLACDDQTSLHCGANLLLATPLQFHHFFELNFLFFVETAIAPKALRHIQEPPPPRID
jgi:hypothetical protein